MACFCGSILSHLIPGSVHLFYIYAHSCSVRGRERKAEPPSPQQTTQGPTNSLTRHTQQTTRGREKQKQNFPTSHPERKRGSVAQSNKNGPPQASGSPCPWEKSARKTRGKEWGGRNSRVNSPPHLQRITMPKGISPKVAQFKCLLCMGEREGFGHGQRIRESLPFKSPPSPFRFKFTAWVHTHLSRREFSSAYFGGENVGGGGEGTHYQPPGS